MSRPYRHLFSPARLLPLALLTTSAGFLACHQPAGVGKAAAPDKAAGHQQVMGGSSNTELAKKVSIIKGLLDGKITRRDVQARLEKDFKHLNGKEKEERLAVLQEALNNLPAGVGDGKALPPGPERDMTLARFYFAERRFIESAEHLTAVLDQAPAYDEARNLLARCFFFLGNHDRTIQELEVRIAQIEKLQKGGNKLSDRNSMEYVDALFLIGAAVAESPGIGQASLQKGQRAWKAYLELAPESPSRERVLKGLSDIEAGLRGEGRLAQGPMSKSANAGGGPQGVTGGSGSFNGAGPAAKAADRVKKLPKNASPFDVALATGLDALDTRNPVEAEKAFMQASQLQPGNVIVETGIARVWVQTGRVDEAMRKYGEIIKQNPKFMPAWHYYGMAHLMNGDPGQAAKSWEYIKKNDPKYFDANNLARRVQVAKRMAKGG